MIRHLGRVEQIEILDEQADAPPCAFELIGDLKVMVPLEGVMDLGAERNRLDKAMAKAKSDLERIQAKLANANFRERAPEQVVAGEEDKRDGLESRLARLKDEREALV